MFFLNPKTQTVSLLILLKNSLSLFRTNPNVNNTVFPSMEFFNPLHKQIQVKLNKKNSFGFKNNVLDLFDRRDLKLNKEIICFFAFTDHSVQ